MYTWLLFDADDTLFDFPKAEANALRWTLEAFGLPFAPEHFTIYARCNKQVWMEFERGEVTAQELRTKRFRLFFDETGLAGDPAVFSPVYLQNLALGGDLLPGAEEVIAALKERYRLALVTNGLKDVQRPRLANSPLKNSFERLFISEELGAAKPAKAYFDAVFAGIGHPPKDRVLIIGDSPTSDMQGGLDYGIHTCWYNPQGQSTEMAITYQVRELRELLGMLG